MRFSNSLFQAVRPIRRRKSPRHVRRAGNRRPLLEVLEARVMLTANWSNYLPDNRPDGGMLNNNNVSLAVDDALVAGDGATANTPVYDSKADGHTTISFLTSDVMPSQTPYPYNKIEASVTLGGVSMGTAEYNAFEGYAQIGLQVDTGSFDTGEYNYSVSFTFWNGSTQVTSLSVIDELGHVSVINRRNIPGTNWHSEFGTGWSLPGLDQLVIQHGMSNRPDGVLLVTGADETAWFDETTPYNFSPNEGPFDFSTLTTDGSGTYTLTAPDQSQRVFDVVGNVGLLHTRVDRDGNTIATYDYDDMDGDGTADELTSITDYFGRVTTFDYNGGPVVKTITDPAGDANRTGVLHERSPERLAAVHYRSRSRHQFLTAGQSPHSI